MPVTPTCVTNGCVLSHWGVIKELILGMLLVAIRTLLPSILELQLVLELIEVVALGYLLLG